MFSVQAGVSCMWTNDSQQLLLEHFDMIHNSPSQLYHSALPFCPSLSWLHECYSLELSQEVGVIEGLSAEWGMCYHTAPLGNYLHSLSYWNNTIAVGCSNRLIIIFDAIIGSQTAVLHGHTMGVRSVTFSSDGTSLVSGSEDETVKLWDVQTGGVIRTFHGHTSYVCSVSISTDHTTIASGSWDKTLRLWNIQNGECYQIIEQQEHVDCVIFSPINPQCLISVSGKTVQQWNANGHKVGPTYDGYWVAFSPDGTKLILYARNDVLVQDINSGVVVAKCSLTKPVPHSTYEFSCCFSPDQRLVAATTFNPYTINVWDITGSDPHLLYNFIGHTRHITSLAFSSHSTLISASMDRSVKFWQIGASSTDSNVTDPRSTSLTLAPTKSTALKPKNGLIPSDLPDGVIKTWGILTGLHNGSLQIPAEGSHQSNTQLIGNKLIFVWYADEMINIWDAEKGELLQTINVPAGGVGDLRISGDGSKVFCSYKESIQAWDIRTGEAVGEVRAQDVGSHFRAGKKVHLGILGIEGSKIWVVFSTSEGFSIVRWDFGIPGSLPVLSPGSRAPPEMLHLNDNKVWETKMSRMKDTVTGKVAVQLPERFREAIHVQWDGHYLVVSFKSKEVVILDFSHVSL